MSGRAVGCLLLMVPMWGGCLQGTVRILDKDGTARRSLADCVAILELAEGLKPRMEPSKPVRIRTLEKRFVPRVTFVTPGTEVAFPNFDTILHNVFSVTPGNRFDTGHYMPGDSPRVRLTRPGLVKLYCNIHHQMNAFVWVVETPYTQLLDGRSGLHFDNVPPGIYRLRLWHPETGDRAWTVAVSEGTSHGEWTLNVALPPVEPHKNKFGKDYPPPKDTADY